VITILRKAGATPDLVYGASLASILLSLAMWFVPRGKGDAAGGRPERMAIFVGLWAPTLALVAHALGAEANHRMGGGGSI
jgi:hypothetical protein